MSERRPYRIPVNGHFGISTATARLYRLEERRDEAIEGAARELGKLWGNSEKNFWTDTMPQALYDILERFDTQAALAAAKAFVRNHEHEEIKGGQKYE